jgi:transposase
MKITTIGIDLAKTIFQAHGVDEHGKVRLRKPLKTEYVICGGEDGADAGGAGAAPSAPGIREGAHRRPTRFAACSPSSGS